ncbi:MAG: sugar phosphate isomerase/epimerase, partial [Parvularculaceae bacterium]|nr:sugar phosphate isomerase/epimerase [Parvularculaceae bacterium]
MTLALRSASLRRRLRFTAPRRVARRPAEDGGPNPAPGACGAMAASVNPVGPPHRLIPRMSPALFLLLGIALAGSIPALAPPKFYAYCIEVGVPGVHPRPWEEQAALLRQLGYDGGGFELSFDDTLEANLLAFDRAGLEVCLVWTSLNVNPGSGPVHDPRLPGALRRLQGRSITVSLLLRGLPPADPRGRATALRALRELGDVADRAGLRLSIYNHVGDWTESLPFIVELVREVNHPRVGFNFNLCHWLKVHAGEDWQPLLRAHASKLFAVTLNGATVGASTWTHGLIRPLDEGDF